MDKILVCPECGSDEVRALECGAFDANTGDFICTAYKAHDDDTYAYCSGRDEDGCYCDWKGLRSDLKERGGNHD